jgi:hypothetical protein
MLATTAVAAVILGYFREPMQVALLLVVVAYVALLLVPWVMDVIHLKRNAWSSADVRYQPIDPQDRTWPDWIIGVIGEIGPQLEALGFRALGHYGLDGIAPSCTSFISLFENRRTQQIAKHLTAIGRSPGSAGTTTMLGFYTEFADGTKLITSNHAARTLRPQRRVHKGSVSIPWVRDPHVLYEIHNLSIAHYAADGIRVERAIFNPAEFLRADRRDHATKQVETGYYYLDVESGVYRPTWKGAILMAWKLLSPVRSVRRIWGHRKAIRILRELGLERLSPESPDGGRGGPVGGRSPLLPQTRSGPL